MLVISWMFAGFRWGSWFWPKTKWLCLGVACIFLAHIHVRTCVCDFAVSFEITAQTHTHTHPHMFADVFQYLQFEFMMRCHLAGLLTFGHVHWSRPVDTGATASCGRSFLVSTCLVVKLQKPWTCYDFHLISVGDCWRLCASSPADAPQWGFSWVNGWTTWVTRSLWAVSRTAVSTTATSEQA